MSVSVPFKNVYSTNNKAAAFITGVNYNVPEEYRYYGKIVDEDGNTLLDVGYAAFMTGGVVLVGNSFKFYVYKGFYVNGLLDYTTYVYSLPGAAPSGLPALSAPSSAPGVKYMIDGMVFIEVNEHTFDIKGNMVR